MCGHFCLCLLCLYACFVEAVRESQSIGGDAGWCGRATEISNTWLCQHQGLCAWCVQWSVGSLYSRTSGFALVGAWWKRQLQQRKCTRVYLVHVCLCVCAQKHIKFVICIWARICDICFLCTGESRANPVCAEFNWGWSSPAHCSGRLSQPTHGESLSGEKCSNPRHS